MRRAMGVFLRYRHQMPGHCISFAIVKPMRSYTTTFLLFLHMYTTAFLLFLHMYPMPFLSFLHVFTMPLFLF